MTVKNALLLLLIQTLITGLVYMLDASLAKKNPNQSHMKKWWRTYFNGILLLLDGLLVQFCYTISMFTGG